MDDEKTRKTLHQLNTKIYDIKTQVLADHNRMATRSQLSELEDKVSNRLLFLAVCGVIVMLSGFFAMH